jgi:hypothetical protein
LEGEAEGELGCHAGFPYAAFAREDEKDVFDVLEGHPCGSLDFSSWVVEILLAGRILDDDSRSGRLYLATFFFSSSGKYSVGFIGMVMK